MILTFKPTQKKIRELFWYSAKTGNFTRRTSRGGSLKGSIAGTIGVEGYVEL